jgi:hypothetical protein
VMVPRLETGNAVMLQRCNTGMLQALLSLNQSSEPGRAARL